MAELVKSLNGLTWGSVSARNSLARASIKSLNGLDTTGGGGFDPSDYGTVELWLIGDESPSGVISTWNVSTYGSPATASGSERPQRADAALNGHHGVRFNGTTNRMLGDIALGGDAISVIATVMINSGSANYARVLSLGDPGVPDYDSVARAGALLRVASGENAGAYRDGAMSLKPITYAVPFVGTSIFDGADQTTYVNGVGATPVASTGTFSVSQYGLGSDTDPIDPAFLDGDIYELLVYSSALSTSSREAVEGYMMTKYGL